MEKKEVKKSGRGHSKDITNEILRLRTENPGLSNREIAKITDCDPSNITRTLQRYEIEQNNANQYQKYRAEILAGLQHRILESISPKDLEKANLYQKIIATSVLYDKERLETGRSTQNISLSKVVQLVEKA